MPVSKIRNKGHKKKLNILHNNIPESKRYDVGLKFFPLSGRPKSQKK